jgi:predicted small lipoprotein YifL
MLFQGLVALLDHDRLRMQGRLNKRLLVALALAGALGLAGCGVRGSLETPPGVKATTGDATPGKPGEPVPHKPSILDPLIR